MNQDQLKSQREEALRSCQDLASQIYEKLSGVRQYANDKQWDHWMEAKTSLRQFDEHIGRCLLEEIAR